MPILNDVSDIKLGDSQVEKVYIGDTLIWPWESFWKFPAPETGQILRINVLTSGDDINVEWGDRGTDALASSPDTTTYYEHVYDGSVRYTGFEINNMSVVTRFWSLGQILGESDTDTYRFGGTIDLAELVNITSYNIYAQGANIKNFNQMTTSITDFRHNDGNITEDTANLNIFRLPNILVFQMQGNQITGSVHDLSLLPNLVSYNFGNNQLSGSLPDLSNSQSLNTLLLDNNQLSGEVPSLATVGSNNVESNTNVTLSNNNFTTISGSFTTNTATSTLLINDNQISGNLPAIDSNYTNIFFLDFSSNLFSGELPSLSLVGSARTQQDCLIFLNDNNLSTLESGFTVNSKLKRLYIQNNNLSQAALDNIIAAVDNANTSDGFLFMNNNAGIITGGVNNANYQNLVSRGWTVSI